MARQVKIDITTALNLVVVQDYDSATQINQMLNAGIGEFAMQQTGHTDLTNTAAALTFIHQYGTVFGSINIADVESVNINGNAATITNLEDLRDAVAPYFFNSGGSGFAFYKEITLTSAILKNNIATTGYEILPAVAGHYYDFSIDWEYTYGTTQYTTGPSTPAFYSYNGSSFQSLAILSNTALTFAGNRLCAGIHPQMISTAHNTFGAGESIVMKLANNQNAAAGDGSVLLKIKYNLIKFTVV